MEEIINRRNKTEETLNRRNTTQNK